MSFTITYPYTSPTETVVICNPDIGNIKEVDHNGIVRRTLGANLKTYKDDLWFTTTTFKYVFSSLTRGMVDELKAFLETSAGGHVAINDHASDDYDGVILNPVFDFVTLKDENGDCDSGDTNGQYRVAFDFLNWIENADYYLLAGEDDVDLDSEADVGLVMENYE